MHKIDIVMATYNGEKYIKEQIDSIRNQTYTNWNLIIRDDGSKDNTISIIKAYQIEDKRIKLIEDDLGNLGFNKNFEYLLTLSTEEFVMISDQDDIWMPEKIEISLYEILMISVESKPKLVFSDAFIFEENDKRLELHIDKNLKKENINNLENIIFMGKNICQGATIIMNKELKERVLPFKDNYIYDYYILFNALLFGEWKFVRKPMLYYRIHNGNQIGIKKNKKNIKYRCEKILNLYPVMFAHINRNLYFLEELHNSQITNNKIRDFIKSFCIKEKRINRIKSIIKNNFFYYDFGLDILLLFNILVNGLEFEIISEIKKTIKKSWK